jgi:hypothetical protein
LVHHVSNKEPSLRSILADATTFTILDIFIEGEVFFASPETTNVYQSGRIKTLSIAASRDFNCASLRHKG